MRVWVNFKELRKRLQFEDVLRHYDVEVKRKGTQHQGFCPLPKHQGKGSSPSFSANLERGIFHCFGCQAKGNVLEFAALMAVTGRFKVYQVGRIKMYHPGGGVMEIV